MIMQSDNIDESTYIWEEAVKALAHDPSHRGNAFILALGGKLGIAQDIIDRSSLDSSALRTKPLGVYDEQLILAAFYDLYTKEELVGSILFQINSQQDGSPGLKTVRMAIFQALCENLQKNSNEDQTFEAIKLYYLNAGQGSPCDDNFTDLNKEALLQYSSTFLGSSSPFAVFSEHYRSISKQYSTSSLL